MWPRTWAGVLALLGLLGAVPASAARQGDNHAFVDPAGTQAVVRAATDALGAVLTYDYRRLDDCIQAARANGTDAYAGRWTDQIDKLRTTATRQKQAVSTKVVGVGVRELHADTGQLVVFLDQTTTRGDTNRTATAGIAAVVDLKMIGGQWKLDNVNRFES
jgi:Mce-associated membrane protein